MTLRKHLIGLCLLLTPAWTTAQESASFGPQELETVLRDDLKKTFEKQPNAIGFRYGIQETPFVVYFNVQQRYMLIRATLPAADFTLEKINAFNGGAIYARAFLDEAHATLETPVVLPGVSREQVVAAFQHAEKEWSDLQGVAYKKTLAPQFDAARGGLLSSEDLEAFLRNDWKKAFGKKQTKYGFYYDVQDTPFYVNFNETGKFVLIYRNLENHLAALSKINDFNRTAVYSRAYLDRTTLSFELPCPRLGLSRQQFVRLIEAANREWVDFVQLAKQSVRLAPAEAVFSHQEGQRRWLTAVELGKQGRFGDAATVYQQLLPWAAHFYGPGHTETGTLLNDFGSTLCQLGRFAQAEPYLERSLRLREAGLGKEHRDVADSLNTMSNMYQGMGLYSKAEPCVTRSLAIWESLVGAEHAEVAHLLNNLGNLYKRTGQYAKAEAAHLRSLAIREKVLGADHADAAQSHFNLSILYLAMGDVTKGEAAAQRSLRIRERILGPDHPLVGDALSMVGNFHYELGQFDKAEPLYERSLRLIEAKLGKNHFAVAECLSHLGFVAKAKRQYAAAETLFQRATQIVEATYSKDHPYVAHSLGTLATLYGDMGQPAKALPLRERAVQILEAKFGMDHPDLGRALNNLAVSLQANGQTDKAESLYQQALRIAEIKLGKEHPFAAQVLGNLAWNAASKKAWPAAIQHVHKSRRAQADYLATVLPSLSEQEQLSFLGANTDWGFHRALSLGWQAPREATDASAEWLLNGKALAHQSLAEQHLLVRDSTDPAHKRLFTQLQELRSRLASLVNQTPKPGFEREYQREVAWLRSAEQGLAQTLARAVGRPQRTNTWFTLEELKAKLGPKAAFVDIARFDAFDFAANKSAGPRYVAWITRAQGPTLLIDLGDAVAIDDLAAELRKTLVESARSIVKVGEEEALATLRKPLEALSAKVLHPLLAELDKADEWIVSPDGALWLTPWSALTLPDGKHCIEKHLIRQVVSGRDLILERPKSSSQSAHVFADPDYDLSPSKVAPPVVVESPNPEITRSTKASLGLIPKVGRLPGTALEAEAVRSKMQAWLGAEPKVYLEGEAGEAAVKSVKSPRVLTLATHGYFLPLQRGAADRAGVATGDEPHRAGFDAEGQPLANPLLRCGLLFAGCNRRTEAKSGDNDGVLTGLEVVGMNLEGCELVVLSACETGLGDVRGGEGVAGLRQAFQLAGAKGVLASLWQVPDRDTALLMNAFYGELAKGKSQAQALREAQLQRLAARRSTFGAAHPFFWAAFTVTSRGE